MRPQETSTFKQHVRLAYRLYQIPADKRPLSCWRLFTLCRDGKYDEAHDLIKTVELLLEAAKAPQEKFDDLVDRLG